MGHFSYVAFDCINKRCARKEVQWRKRRGQQIAGDEDKNDDTIDDSVWCILNCDFLPHFYV